MEKKIIERYFEQGPSNSYCNEVLVFGKEKYIVDKIRKPNSAFIKDFNLKEGDLVTIMDIRTIPVGEGEDVYSDSLLIKANGHEMRYSSSWFSKNISKTCEFYLVF